MLYIGQSLVALDHEGCRLRWTPSAATDLKGYLVYMSAQDDRHFIRQTPQAIPDAEWHSPPLRKDMKYYFYITAVDRSGNESGPSDIIPFQLSDTVIDTNLIPVDVIWGLPIAGGTMISKSFSTSDFMTSFRLGG